MLLRNGVIWTGDPARPWAESILVDGGIIRDVGPDARVAADAGGGIRVVDLGGAFVCPGLVDAHAHVLGLGLALTRIDLVGAATLDETLARVAERVARMAAREETGWVLGRGWDQNDWPGQAFPDRRDLDRVTGHRPASLTRIDGHAVWANSAALREAGIDRDTPDPDGGKIHRDAAGEPTGILVDNAVDLLQAVIPEPDAATKRRAVLDALNAMVRAGLTGVHDMGMSADELAIYRGMAADGEAPARVYASIAAVDPELERVLREGPDRDWRGGWFKLGMVKFYLDGALGSRGAALLEPYSDDPGNRGLLLTEPATFRRLLERTLDAGFQAAVHAIGDRGNRLALDTWESVLDAHPEFRRLRAVPPAPLSGIGEVPAALPGFRIEHAQVLDVHDLARLGELDAVASMQPTHCTSDMPWAPERLGPARLRGAYAWRTVIDGGAVFCSGSDFPVESHDPRLGLYAAVTRRASDGSPPEGWNPGERLSRDEALVSFTAAPAWVSGDLGRRGTLTPGKDADLVVFDRNLVTCDPQAILTARPLLTLVGGRAVWTDPDGPFGDRAED